jgi:hypothetical protein
VFSRDVTANELIEIILERGLDETVRPQTKVTESNPHPAEGRPDDNTPQYYLTHNARMHLINDRGVADESTTHEILRLSQPELAVLAENGIVFDLIEARAGKGLYKVEGFRYRHYVSQTDPTLPTTDPRYDLKANIATWRLSQLKDTCGASINC